MFDTPTGANFSRCRRFRYTLWRRWDETLPPVMMIGLNPSTADANRNDPTIRRCIGFAKSWGHGGLVMTNLFAFRATYPTDLKAAPDPVGPRNDWWIRQAARHTSRIVALWGNDGQWLNRSVRIRKMLAGRLQVIRMNAGGEPAHPLYLPKHLQPQDWC